MIFLDFMVCYTILISLQMCPLGTPSWCSHCCLKCTTFCIVLNTLYQFPRGQSNTVVYKFQILILGTSYFNTGIPEYTNFIKRNDPANVTLFKIYFICCIVYCFQPTVRRSKFSYISPFSDK